MHTSWNKHRIIMFVASVVHTKLQSGNIPIKIGSKVKINNLAVMSWGTYQRSTFGIRQEKRAAHFHFPTPPASLHLSPFCHLGR